RGIRKLEYFRFLFQYSSQSKDTVIRILFVRNCKLPLSWSDFNYLKIQRLIIFIKVSYDIGLQGAMYFAANIQLFMAKLRGGTFVRFAQRILWLMLLAFLIGIGTASAQVPTGSIVGTVLDAQKAAVPGATVTITSEDTGAKYTTKTAANGEYSVASLNFGFYRVDVVKDGFKAGSVTGLKLDASSRLSVPPIVLEVGAQSETVTVEASTSQQVQTTDASVGSQISTEQLQN